jgi:hypothetical protein
MARFVAWVTRNVDGLIALLLAVCIGILGLADVVGTDQVTEATLLILAVVAVVLLRDRIHATVVEREIRSRLDRVGEIEETVQIMRTAMEEMAGVRVLHGPEVGKALEKARKTTDHWTFKGGTGTYLRAVTLPGCIDQARREKRGVRIRLQIIDPTNEELCDRYARFRRSLSAQPDGTGERWTLERTRKESFATVLAACWHRQRFDLLDIDVRLASLATTFRWDLSSQCIIITQEDPQVPALMFERGKFYYDRWNTELQTTLDQARRVPVEEAAKAVSLSEEPTVEEVSRLFTRLNLELPSSFSPRSIQDIIQKAIQAKNPY